MTMMLFASNTCATTSVGDFAAMQVLASTWLPNSQLTGWATNNGDPCDNNWFGVTCDKSTGASNRQVTQL